MEKKKNDIPNNFKNKSVEEIWNAFESALQQGISQFVPVKKIGVKKSLAWVTQEIKRLILVKPLTR